MTNFEKHKDEINVSTLKEWIKEHNIEEKKMLFEELYNVLPKDTRYLICDQLLDEYETNKRKRDTYCPLTLCSPMYGKTNNRENVKHTMSCRVVSSAWNSRHTLLVRLFGACKYYELSVNNVLIGVYPNEVIDEALDEYLKAYNIKEYTHETKEVILND